MLYIGQHLNVFTVGDVFPQITNLSFFFCFLNVLICLVAKGQYYCLVCVLNMRLRLGDVSLALLSLELRQETRWGCKSLQNNNLSLLHLHKKQ